MSNESMTLVQTCTRRHLHSSKGKDRHKRNIGNVERNPLSHDSRKKDSQARADRVSGGRALCLAETAPVSNLYARASPMPRGNEQTKLVIKRHGPCILTRCSFTQPSIAM